jgi:hypothetical protein
MVFHLLQVFTAETGEEMFKESPLFRCFGMQGKGPPADIYIIFLFQPFNTPGNEIAPGSDVIGIYFKC